MKPFYHYGEGSITHGGDGSCEHGLGIHHPSIQRTEWPSRRSYWASQIRNAYYHRFELRHLVRALPRDDDGRPLSLRVDMRPTWLDKLVTRLFGPPFRQVPTVWAALRPEDSIYPRAVEEAEHWAQMRSGTRPSTSPAGRPR